MHTYICRFYLTQLQKTIHLTILGLMPMYQMSESYFLSGFSLIQKDPHKLRARGKQGDMVCQDVYGFSRNRYGGTMVFLQLYCLTTTPLQTQ